MKDKLGIRRPLNAQNFIMMTRVRSVEHERSKLPHQMVGRSPDLDMRIMGDCDVP